MVGRRSLTLLSLVLLGLCRYGLAAPGVTVADARILVEASGYRLIVRQDTCDLSLELRGGDGAWLPVTKDPAGISFGLLTADQALTSNGLAIHWVQAAFGDAVSLAGRLSLDPLGGTTMDVHLLCTDEGILMGAQVGGDAGLHEGSLWCPPRFTLPPAQWQRYAFWGAAGQFHSGRLADFEPTPGSAGVSPWEKQGDTVPALDARRPALIAQPATGGPGLGVVLVDYGGRWQGSSCFLQRHTPTALYFYCGYAPLAQSSTALRWAWLAPFPEPDEAALAARVGALLNRADELLAAYRPGPLPLAAGAEPIPEFPAALRRAQPVQDIGDAVVYTVNEGTRSAYGLDLARKVGSEVMIRAWFKWAQAPPVQRWRELPSQAHAFGALFGGGITCSALYDTENGLTREQVLDMATRGPDGTLVDAWDHPGIRHGSLSSPAYMEYLFRWCREQIEAGADYLFMDEHTAALSEREGYDDHSLADFRRFLLDECMLGRGWAASDPRWLSELGIDCADRTLCPDGTMASFDYRRFLTTGGHLERPQRAENPLAGPWGEFRAWRDDRAWKQLTDRIRACAAGLGRRILISANGLAPYVDLQVLGVWGQWTTHDGHIDVSEDLVPAWRSLVLNGQQQAGAAVPVVLFHDWGFGEPPFPWLAVPPAEREVWLRTRGAEIYAAGAFFAFPVLGPFGCDALRDGTLRAMSRQTAFYAAQRDLYLHSRWLGREGLSAEVEKLSLAASWCASQRAVALHIINRDLRAGVLQPRQTPVTVRLPLTSMPASTSAISPDHDGEREAACRLADGRLEVTLAGLEAYTVVLLRYATEPDLSGIADPCRVWPAKHWARPRRAEFRVLPGGLVEHGAELEAYLQGRLHTHLRNPPVFVLDAAGPVDLCLRVRAVATAGARLIVRVDDAPPQTVDLPDLDGKNTDAPEYNRTLSFAIPAGSHRVAVDNTGGDWLILDWLEFRGQFRAPPAVSAAGHASVPWTAAALRKAEDAVGIGGTALRPLIEIDCPSGIGAVELAPGDGPWPRELRVRLRYGPQRPFLRLEGFEAVLTGADSAKLFRVEAPLVSGPAGVDLVVPLPARRPEQAAVRLSWVDLYR